MNDKAIFDVRSEWQTIWYIRNGKHKKLNGVHDVMSIHRLAMFVSLKRNEDVLFVHGDPGRSAGCPDRKH